MKFLLQSASQYVKKMRRVISNEQNFFPSINTELVTN